MWQLRPDLTYAAPDSLRVGGYYRRNRLVDKPVGTGLIIAAHGEHPELPPDGGLAGRIVPSTTIAAQVAAALDGVHLVAAVPDADDLALSRWLAANGQVLTNHYRHRDIETMMHGYLLGRHAEWAAHRHHPGDDVNPWPLSGPPFDPKPMYEALGVPLLGPGEAHNAMHDCRQVRTAWDVMHGQQIDTIQ